MKADRKSLLDSAVEWFTNLGELLKAVMPLPQVDGTGKSDPAAAADSDFDGWVANDPMVTLNPASRYGDDGTGFLAGSEVENPDRGGKDD